MSKKVSVEVSYEDDWQDVAMAFIRGMRELGIKVTETPPDDDPLKPTVYVLSLPEKKK